MLRDGRTACPTVCSGNQRGSIVIIGHARARRFDVVGDHFGGLRSDEHVPLAVQLPPEWRPRSGPVSDLDRRSSLIEVLHVERAEAADPHPALPEEQEDDVSGAGVVELREPVQDRHGFVSGHKVVAGLDFRDLDQLMWSGGDGLNRLANWMKFLTIRMSLRQVMGLTDRRWCSSNRAIVSLVTSRMSAVPSLSRKSRNCRRVAS